MSWIPWTKQPLCECITLSKISWSLSAQLKCAISKRERRFMEDEFYVHVINLETTPGTLGFA